MFCMGFNCQTTGVPQYNLMVQHCTCIMEYSSIVDTVDMVERNIF